MALNLSFETAYGLLRNIELYTASDYDALGVTPQDFKVLVGDITWRREQMHTIMRTYNCILFGTLEILGMQKIQIPAEMQAAVIITTVSPCNVFLAVSWLAQEGRLGPSVSDASQRSAGSAPEPATEGQLLALCTLLANSDRMQDARSRMMSKLGIAVEASMEQQVNGQTNSRKAR